MANYNTIFEHISNYKSMKFNTTLEQKVKNYFTLLALEIEDSNGEKFARIYYNVTYDNDTEFVFFTTNEYDFSEKQPIINEDFTVILNFESLINSFENSEWLTMDSKNNFILKYIYYDIIIIDNSLIPLMLKHLKYNISGYTEIDYNENEKKKLKIWLDYLSP